MAPSSFSISLGSVSSSLSRVSVSLSSSSSFSSYSSQSSSSRPNYFYSSSSSYSYSDSYSSSSSLPPFVGCTCPAGYTCMDNIDGNNPSGNDNRCCNKENGDPGDGCCKDENYFEGEFGEKLCCEDGEIAQYHMDQNSNITFTCSFDCGEGFVAGEEVVQVDGESYVMGYCCPEGTPKLKGLGIEKGEKFNPSGEPVCCLEDSVYCGGSCCPTGVEGDDPEAIYCADIKDSFRYIRIHEDGTREVVPARSCCSKDGQVQCPSGVCCDADKCMSSLTEAQENSLKEADESMINELILGKITYTCCNGTVYRSASDTKQYCCDGTVYTDSNDPDYQGCCARPNDYYVGSVTNSFTGELIDVCCNPLTDNTTGTCGSSCCKLGEYCAYSNWETEIFACCPSGEAYDENTGRCTNESESSTSSGSYNSYEAESVSSVSSKSLESQASCESGSYACGTNCCSSEQDCYNDRSECCDGKFVNGTCCPTERVYDGSKCCDEGKVAYTSYLGSGCCEIDRIYTHDIYEYCCREPLCGGECCGEGRTCDNGECKGEYNCMSGENFKPLGCTPGSMTEECCGGNCIRFEDDIYRCSLGEKNYGKLCENDADCDSYKLRCESGRCVVS
ncbi:MAG: hypothetical protein ACOX3T_07315 [Bdellovibrionota bacterium]